MTLIFVQLLLLLLSAGGWGYWIWKACGASRVRGWKSHGWFFFGSAGFSCGVLTLQSLVYFNLPLRLTTWLALAAAIGGVVTFCFDRRARGSLAHRRSRAEMMAAGLLFIIVFSWQGAPLFKAGAANYYGNAHTDQVNYVLLAQFLAEKPFSTSLEDIGLQPWLAKAVHLKGIRLGASVADGYLGVVTLTDAKRAYGTLSIFVVCLAAVSLFVLARVLSVPRSLSVLTGLWWGALPAVTKLHLDGFFSQSCVLFVFPAVAAVFYVRRGALERTPLVLLTIYLSYLLCTYAEVYVLGIGLLGSMLLLAARPHTPLKHRVTAGVIIALCSLLLTGGYVVYFARYIVDQYRIAGDPALLADLTPMSGTWVGWKQIFFGYELIANVKLERACLLGSFGVIFFGCSAFQGQKLFKRRFLLAVAATPIAVLAVLLSAPILPKYAFSKLLDTFTPLWLLLAAVGIVHLADVLPWRRILGRPIALAVVGGFFLLALRGSWPQWRAVREGQGILAAVDSPQARRCYAAAEKNTKAVYLIDEPHNLLCAWLAYAARHSKAYVDADLITDLPIPATLFAFRILPPVSDALVILDAKGPRKVDKFQGPPDIVVRNPQGVEGVESNRFYWIGLDATLELVDYTSPPGASHRYSLVFEAMAGPANPDPARELTLSDLDGSEQRFEFSAQASGHFVVTVHPGKNIYVLKATRPMQTVVIPTDTRNLMVRISRLALTSLPDSTQEIPGATGADGP